ncbi:MAG: hypothetical protein VX681_00870 [Myxococcota bacterium]|nr:hypothetical protein [Myxococcota bacterium]
MRFEGWVITGWAVAAMGTLVVILLALFGASEEAAREVVRWSVRLGAVSFSAAFAARPLRQLVANDATKWLLRNRRYVGLSFAVMHFTHLAALGVLAVAFPAYFEGGVDAITLYGGGVAYLLLAGMTLTSFDRTAAMIGRRGWKILHTSGAWLLWVVLAFNYTSAAVEQDVRYAPLSLLLIATFVLRMWQRFAHRSAASVRPLPG